MFFFVSKEFDVSAGGGGIGILHNQVPLNLRNVFKHAVYPPPRPPAPPQSPGKAVEVRGRSGVSPFRFWPEPGQEKGLGARGAHFTNCLGLALPALQGLPIRVCRNQTSFCL